jgi:hypothetical protein
VYSYQDRNIETYKLTNIEDSLYLEYDSDTIEFSQTAVRFSYIKKDMRVLIWSIEKFGHLTLAYFNMISWIELIDEKCD